MRITKHDSIFQNTLYEIEKHSFVNCRFSIKMFSFYIQSRLWKLLIILVFFSCARGLNLSATLLRYICLMTTIDWNLINFTGKLIFGGGGRGRAVLKNFKLIFYVPHYVILLLLLYLVNMYLLIPSLIDFSHKIFKY